MHLAFLVLFSVLSKCQTLPYDREPMCTSNYDFQEKLLEKVLRMELWLETMKARVDADLDTFSRDNDKFTSEFENMRNIMSETVNEVNKNFEALEGKAALKLTEIEEKAEETSLNLRREIESSVKPDIVFHVRDVAVQPTASSVITFSTTVENTDKVYDLDTGYFTAPRNGTYWFSAQICSTSNKYVAPSIYVRGSVVSRVFVNNNNDVDCNSVHAVSILKVNDKAWLQGGPDLSSTPIFAHRDYVLNNFMGALIN